MNEDAIQPSSLDSLLCRVCSDIAQHDLVVSGMKKRNGTKKVIRILIASAILISVFATGIFATWPKIELILRESGIYITVSSDENGTYNAKLQFGYLPENAHVSSLKYSDGGVLESGCVISIQNDSFILVKIPLTAEAVLDPGSSVESLQRLMDHVKVFTTVSEITASDLASGIIYWPTSNAYYMLLPIADSQIAESSLDSMLTIIQNLQ